MKSPFGIRRPSLLPTVALFFAALSLPTWLAPPPATAQTPRVVSLQSARRCAALLAHDGFVYGGTSDGGVVAWPVDDPEAYSRWTPAEGMTGNDVVDLGWTGSHLWAATAGAGLTRIDISGAQPLFRQFTNLGGLDLTAVAGFTAGSTERVYYGMAEGGVGEIVGGFPGAVYTAATTPGLVDDRVRDLAFFDGDLWIATADGVSVLADNVFAERSAGLPVRPVAALCASGDTLLMAATEGGGVARWNAASDRWEVMGSLGGWVGYLAVADGVPWALRSGIGLTDLLYRWDGSAWITVAMTESITRALAGGTVLWTAGQHNVNDDRNRSGHAFLARYDDGWTTWTTRELVFTGVAGAAFGPDGTPWVGGRLGEAVSGRPDGQDWRQLYDVADAGNDSLGLFNHDGGLLAMAVTPSGEVWASQFGSGLVRYRPSLPDVDLVTAAGSGLAGRFVSGVEAHPDGALILLSDRDGAQILVRPDDWTAPGSWLTLPTDNSALGGADIRAAATASRDRIWFAVQDVGVVLWDINGAIPADGPLTWFDNGDDIWSPPLESVATSPFVFTAVSDLAVGADGTIWAGGGNGVVHFRLDRYSASQLDIQVLATYLEKTPAREGLLRAAAGGVALDANEDLWVTHDAGLSRIRLRGETTFIDAFSSVQDFVLFGFGALYSSDIIAGLPGGAVNSIAADNPRRRLLLGTMQGPALLEVPARTDGAGGPLEGIFLYPNPYFPDVGGGARLGGYGDLLETVDVSIFNLEGQPILTRRDLREGESFWTGRSLTGEIVATGPYLVRIEARGQAALKTLMVVRGQEATQ